MLIEALLLLIGQGAAASLADEARAASIASESAVQIMEACAPGRRGPGTAGQALRRSHDVLRAEATGLLPSIGETIDTVLPPICRGRHAGENWRRAAAAVDRFAAAVARRRAGTGGLWFGPLHLCGGTVLAVEDGRDEMDRGQILIRFSPTMREAVAVETSRRVRT